MGAISDDEFELVEHPHEEATHVDHPSPVSDVDETETTDPSTEALENLGPAAKINSISQSRASVHLHGSMRSWFGVLILMAILRLSGAPNPQPTVFQRPLDHVGVGGGGYHYRESLRVGWGLDRV